MTDDSKAEVILHEKTISVEKTIS